jgi:hypothetical protein
MEMQYCLTFTGTAVLQIYSVVYTDHKRFCAGYSEDKRFYIVQYYLFTLAVTH